MNATHAHAKIEKACRSLPKQTGRKLRAGEVVQDGDLLYVMPDGDLIPSMAIGLTISEYDVGWYVRPDQGGKQS